MLPIVQYPARSYYSLYLWDLIFTFCRWTWTACSCLQQSGGVSKLPCQCFPLACHPPSHASHPHYLLQLSPQCNPAYPLPGSGQEIPTHHKEYLSHLPELLLICLRKAGHCSHRTQMWKLIHGCCWKTGQGLCLFLATATSVLELTMLIWRPAAGSKGPLELEEHILHTLGLWMMIADSDFHVYYWLMVAVVAPSTTEEIYKLLESDFISEWGATGWFFLGVVFKGEHFVHYKLDPSLGCPTRGPVGN